MAPRRVRPVSHPPRGACRLGKGVNVCTPNKKVGSGPLKRYKECLSGMDKTGSMWGDETTVGAGLPILNTLRTDLIQTGDTVETIEVRLHPDAGPRERGWSLRRSARRAGHLLGHSLVHLQHLQAGHEVGPRPPDRAPSVCYGRPQRRGCLISPSPKDASANASSPPPPSPRGTRAGSRT